MLVGGIAIPGGVAVLNRLGLGPFNPVLSGEELRRAGLLAMSRVAETLAPGAEHVIFGHTHRPGPLGRTTTRPSGRRCRAADCGTAAAGTTSRPSCRAGREQPVLAGERDVARSRGPAAV